MSPLPFLPLFVAALLLTQERAATISGLAIGLSSALGALSSVYLGRLGDRVGHKRVLLICSFGAAVGYGAMTLVAYPWQLLVMYAATGVALGGIIPSVAALLTHTTPSEQMGSVYGLDASVSSIGRMTSPMLVATLVTLVGLRGMFVFVFGIFVMLAVLVAWYRPEHHVVQEKTESSATPEGDLVGQ
jgi:DHA1 family multidrug resistance protein-like MFS transporter